VANTTAPGSALVVAQFITLKQSEFGVGITYVNNEIHVRVYND
jgi:hypothetical protein